jgi:protein-tyrosine phosphatase
MNVLFVCLGNVCRSPIAEALLKKKYAEHNIKANVDSAGFEPYHINKPPDNKAIKAAKKYGLKLSGNARIFVKDDFDRFDRIYAMDAQNYMDLIELCRNENDKSKVDLIMNVIEAGKNSNLPDPFRSGDENYDDVYEILDKATDSLVKIAQQKIPKK